MDQFAMKVIQHSGDMRDMANISETVRRLEGEGQPADCWRLLLVLGVSFASDNTVVD
jgi:hypothetical protein